MYFCTASIRCRLFECWIVCGRKYSKSKTGLCSKFKKVQHTGLSVGVYSAPTVQPVRLPGIIRRGIVCTGTSSVPRAMTLFAIGFPLRIRTERLHTKPV